MKEEKLKGFEKTAEIFGAIRIFLSPFIAALAIAAIVYLSKPSTITLIISILIVFAGIILGFILASKIYKSQKGTVHFLSRTDATPELDEEEKEK